MQGFFEPEPVGDCADRASEVGEGRGRQVLSPRFLATPWLLCGPWCPLGLLDCDGAIAHASLIAAMVRRRCCSLLCCVSHASGRRSFPGMIFCGNSFVLLPVFSMVKNTTALPGGI
jgi:hypothetical protein